MAEQPEEKRSGSAFGAVVSGVAGGAVAGGVTYTQLGKQRLMDVAQFENPETKIGKKFTEALGKHGNDRAAAMGELGLDTVQTRVAALDKAKIKTARAANKALSGLDATSYGYRLLNDAQLHDIDHSIASLQFEKAGDAFTAHVAIKPNEFARLEQTHLKNLGVVDHVYKIEGIKTLPHGVEIAQDALKSEIINGNAIHGLTATEGGIPWATEVTQAFEKTKVESNIVKESNKVLRKAGGMGWSWGNLTKGGKGAVIGATVGGVAVGAFTLNAIFGGKHTDKIKAQDTQPTAARG